MSRYPHLFTIIEARNVVNTDEVEEFLSQFKPEKPEIQKWIKSNLRNWIINEQKARKYSKKPGESSPEWLKKAYESGADLVEVELNRTLKDRIDHTLDWLETRGPENLTRMTPTEAFKQAKEWVSKLKGVKGKDTDKDSKLIVTLEDGWGAYALTSEMGVVREGTKMNICLKDKENRYWDKVKEGRIFLVSIRDSKGEPHATIEINSDGSIDQIKGNSNLPVKPEYHKYVQEFLKKNS